MRVLCLIDTMPKPGDRWMWNYLPSSKDEIDFLFTTATDRFQKWGKLVSYYPPYWQLGLRALQKTRRKKYDVVVAWEGKNGFPYAVLRRIVGQETPPLAIFAFNIRGPIRHFLPLARFGVRSVTHTVVFTPVEVKYYQEMLSISPGAISYCPLGWYDPTIWYKPRSEHLPEGLSPSERYIMASGRSFRDYATLARAVAGLDVKVMVSAREFNLAGLDLPDNLVATGWLSKRDFMDYIYYSQFYVVPLQPISHAGGDSSLIQAMSFSKAIVATRAPSTETYIEPGSTGILVAPGNVKEMREAILALWNNPQEAARMGQEARRRFEEYYTIEKFAQRFYDIVSDIHHAKHG